MEGMDTDRERGIALTAVVMGFPSCASVDTTNNDSVSSGRIEDSWQALVLQRVEQSVWLTLWSTTWETDPRFIASSIP
jgi:hypothetical protein